jgi:5-methylcytosine-specific restriction endonuclease McrA
MTKCLECNEVFYDEAARLNHRCPIATIPRQFPVEDVCTTCGLLKPCMRVESMGAVCLDCIDDHKAIGV